MFSLRNKKNYEISSIPHLTGALSVASFCRIVVKKANILQRVATDCHLSICMNFLY